MGPVALREEGEGKAGCILSCLLHSVRAAGSAIRVCGEFDSWRQIRKVREAFKDAGPRTVVDDATDPTIVDEPNCCSGGAWGKPKVAGSHNHFFAAFFSWRARPESKRGQPAARIVQGMRPSTGLPANTCSGSGMSSSRSRKTRAETTRTRSWPRASQRQRCRADCCRCSGRRCDQQCGNRIDDPARVLRSRRRLADELLRRDERNVDCGKPNQSREHQGAEASTSGAQDVAGLAGDGENSAAANASARPSSASRNLIQRSAD